MEGLDRFRFFFLEEGLGKKKKDQYFRVGLIPWGTLLLYLYYFARLPIVFFHDIRYKNDDCCKLYSHFFF